MSENSTPTPDTGTPPRPWSRLRRPWSRTGGPDTPDPGNKRPAITLLIIGLVLAVTGIVLTGRHAGNDTTSTGPAEQVSLTAVLAAADAGQLSQALLPISGSVATVTTNTPITSGPLVDEVGTTIPTGTDLSVTIPTGISEKAVTTLTAAGVQVWMGSTWPDNSRHDATPLPPKEGPATSPWTFDLIAGLALLLIGGVIALLGALRLNKSTRTSATPATEPSTTAPTTRFQDVAGADEAVEQIAELVDFLKNPDKYTAIGAKIPSGALLVGPPGTGKTLLARALAGEAGVPFYAHAGSDLVEKYVGVGAKRVRAIFDTARKTAPSIVFFDEIDAVARRRSDSAGSGGSQETENTLNALLHELDGFYDSPVIVIAATNRADILDPAITRPGRLERRIEVPLPDRRGREQILRVHAGDVRIRDDVDYTELARRTPGFSGAQLASVINEAALEAIRRDATEVDSACLDQAVATVAMGKARVSAVVTDHDRRITAWHEAGHTVAALLLVDAAPPVAVSIIPRGPAGGVTWMAEGDDLFLSRSRAHAQMVVALGGRAAEQLLLGGEFTQGAASDLQQATETALKMATLFGMTRLGLASRSDHLGGTGTTDVTDVVEELLAHAHEQALELLTSHMDLMESIAQELLDKDDLTREDLDRIAAQHGVTPASAAPVLPPVPQPAQSAQRRTQRSDTRGSRPDPHRRDSLVTRVRGAWNRRRSGVATG